MQVFKIIKSGHRIEASCTCGHPMKLLDRDHQYCKNNFAGPHGFNMPDDVHAFECKNVYHKEDYESLQCKREGRKDITKDC